MRFRLDTHKIAANMRLILLNTRLIPLKQAKEIFRNGKQHRKNQSDDAATMCETGTNIEK